MIAAFSLVVYSGASALGLEPPSPRLFVQASVQYFVFVFAVLVIAYLAGALASHGKTVLGVVGSGQRLSRFGLFLYSRISLRPGHL